MPLSFSQVFNAEKTTASMLTQKIWTFYFLYNNKWG